MPLEDVQIRLDAFEGPMDLLLHLIRKNEVEITDIPIARITEQYLATLSAGGVDRIDIELAGEFLVMAATLMEIKSKMLMPAPEAGADEQAADSGALPAGEKEDPRSELVRQLLAYKRFRDAAAGLDRRLSEWERRFPGGGASVPDVPLVDPDSEVEIDDLAITDLTRAFAAIMETVDFSRVGEHLVTDDETPIQLHAADIMDRLQRDVSPVKGTIEFRELFAGRTRAEMIGLFLAMLELIRQRKVQARQDRINDTIVIALAQTEDGTTTLQDPAQETRP